MKWLPGAVACICAAVLAQALTSVQAQTQAQTQSSVWPAVTQTARPWVRWWWPGSAVERGALTAQLEAFAAAGIGGVEITPIYGARGGQDVDYLSPQWLALLEHVAVEARRLGIGVDMATGTGWPFGGPRVRPEDAASSLLLVDGRLAGKPTGMKVKRAAPGGEGLVLDPYSTGAIERYLEPFTEALGKLPCGALRAQFHDSFEYFNASWSPALPDAFRAMHGYDIQAFAAEIAGDKALDADTLGRVKGDYRRTLATLHLDYMQRWSRWAREHCFQTRNQAHGAPGRLLDLYAAANIPETESFGATHLPITGLRQDAADISEDPDPPVALIARFASSAAHVAGRPLVSSETLTWLRENFRELPSAAKPQLDRLFTAGVNHVVYHGSTYSPADATWPGWFFYAASQLNPSNPLWRDFGAMHAYVARVQSVLQAGRPDNDLLLYWPENDLLDDPAGLMRQMGMHDNAWLVGSPGGQLALRLLAAGHGFDFISDAQLQELRVERGRLVAPGGSYRLLLVPRTRRMPLETLSRLRDLRADKAAVWFEAMPEDVPGFGRLAQRRGAFQSLLADATLRGAARSLEQELAARNIAPEGAAARGLWFTRRARDDGFDWLLVNPTGAAVEGWVPLARAAETVVMLDALNGDAGRAAVRRGAGGRAEVYLQLASGQSVLLRSYPAARALATPAWRYMAPTGRDAGETLTGAWQVEFLAGGPTLPPARNTRELTSWTTWNEAGERFSGTARYRLVFDAPKIPADEWRLDLGELRETARVTLNGKLLGTAWSLPSSLRVGGALRSRDNLLEIEVTNLPANRVRDLDLRKVDWKIMRDINLASLRYQALDAATWAPAPSGLLGPVRLVPLRLVSPTK